MWTLWPTCNLVPGWICCDQCSIWIHRSCVEMCSADYRALCHSNVQWICCKCETINISTFTFRSYELSSQNYYEPLSEDISQNSWKWTDQFSPLLTSSPKTLPPQQSKNQLSKHSLSTDNRQENEHRKQNSVEDRTSAASSDVPEMKTKENLRILNINCQSITDKKAEFAATLEYIKPDIVCGTESWLHGIQPEKNPATNATGSSEVFPPGYTPYRSDRSTLRVGVFVLVKEDLVSTGIEKVKEINSDAEISWTRVKTKAKDVSFYMPKCQMDHLDQLDASLEKIARKGDKNVILCGVFNCPDVDWSNHTVPARAPDSLVQKRLVEIADKHGLHQVHDNPPEEKTYLTWCFPQTQPCLKPLSAYQDCLITTWWSVTSASDPSK